MARDNQFECVHTATDRTDPYLIQGPHSRRIFGRTNVLPDSEIHFKLVDAGGWPLPLAPIA
jgi:hypothetical protein